LRNMNRWLREAMGVVLPDTAPGGPKLVNGRPARGDAKTLFGAGRPNSTTLFLATLREWKGAILLVLSSRPSRWPRRRAGRAHCPGTAPHNSAGSYRPGNPKPSRPAAELGPSLICFVELSVPFGWLLQWKRKMRSLPALCPRVASGRRMVQEIAYALRSEFRSRRRRSISSTPRRTRLREARVLSAS
jgi:hypothetical protein